MRIMRLALLIVCTQWAVCSSALGDARGIIGIDIGTDFTKVVAIGKKNFDIVTNIESKRKTQTLVGFNDGERVFGGSAVNLIARKPKAAFTSFRTVLGRKLAHPRVQKLATQNFPIKLLEKYGRAAFSFSGVEESAVEVLTPEELTAMLLNYVKKITLDHSKFEPNDCAITVPSFYTQHEKQALLDAASLAGLNVLSLVDENTAAAIHYAKTKRFSKPTHILYYNLGANGVQVTIAKHGLTAHGEAGKKTMISSVKVLAKASNELVGAMYFEDLIVNYCMEQFNANPKRKGKPDLRQDERRLGAIKKDAAKMKTSLSAGKRAVCRLEVDDTDLSAVITRDKLEELAAPLFKQLTGPINDALKSAKLEVAKIDLVEVLGGGVRIPKVQAVLKEVFGDKELDVHLNGDEAFAFGAAFYAATLSDRFQVTPISITDISSLAIGVKLTEETGDWNKEVTVFKAGTKLGKKQTVRVPPSGNGKDVECALRYVRKITEGSQPEIVKYKISGIQQLTSSFKEGTKSKLHLMFELNSGGMVSLPTAELVTEATETDQAQTHKLQVIADYSGLALAPLNAEQTATSAKLLAEFDAQDAARREIQEAMNKLESYIYTSKDRLSNDFEMENSSEEEREEVMQKLNDMSDWLEDNSGGLGVTEYSEKLKTLQQDVAPLFKKIDALIAEVEAKRKEEKRRAKEEEERQADGDL